MNTEKLHRPDRNPSVPQFLAQTLDSVNMNVMFFASVEGRPLTGIVQNVEADRAQVFLNTIDASYDSGGDWWFPYSTAYSSQDGSGWYSMPAAGDQARVFFPSDNEGDAFAASSVTKHVRPRITDKCWCGKNHCHIRSCLYAERGLHRSVSVPALSPGSRRGDEPLHGRAGHAEQLHKTVIGQFDLLFRSIVRMQERGLLDAVHSVALSFPYSSLLCGNPRMIFGVYPDLPFLTSRLIQEIFSAPGSFRTGTHFMRTRSTGRKSWGWEPLSALRTSKSSMWDTAR